MYPCTGGNDDSGIGFSGLQIWYLSNSSQAVELDEPYFVTRSARSALESGWRSWGYGERALLLSMSFSGIRMMRNVQVESGVNLFIAYLT